MQQNHWCSSIRYQVSGIHGGVQNRIAVDTRVCLYSECTISSKWTNSPYILYQLFYSCIPLDGNLYISLLVCTATPTHTCMPVRIHTHITKTGNFLHLIVKGWDMKFSSHQCSNTEQTKQQIECWDVEVRFLHILCGSSSDWEQGNLQWHLGP